LTISHNLFNTRTNATYNNNNNTNSANPMRPATWTPPSRLKKSMITQLPIPVWKNAPTEPPNGASPNHPKYPADELQHAGPLGKWPGAPLNAGDGAPTLHPTIEEKTENGGTDGKNGSGPGLLSPLSNVSTNESPNPSPVQSYDAVITSEIFAMNTKQTMQTRTVPFLQRIQLTVTGHGGNMIGATGQVDNNANRNYISAKRWQHHAYHLGALQESRTTISVANNTRIPSMGIWIGIVRVGETEVESLFEVFWITTGEVELFNAKEEMEGGEGKDAAVMESNVKMAVKVLTSPEVILLHVSLEYSVKSDGPVLSYIEPVRDQIMSMATKDNREQTKPFMQRVQLIEKGVVRATVLGQRVLLGKL